MKQAAIKAKDGIVKSYSATVRTAKRVYHTAAFVSLCLVSLAGYQAYHGKLIKFDGVAHYEMPIGSPEHAMIAQLPADQVLPPQVSMPVPQKVMKVSATGPLPGVKPVPPKVR